jgi:hypothetical protein
MTFADPNNRWLLGLPDEDGPIDQNWIRSGTSTETPPEYSDYTGTGTDPASNYEKIIDGTWAPYRLAAYTTTGGICKGGPAWDQYLNLSQLKNTASVDVVFTSDKSKWTRCPVLELQEDAALAIGGAKKMSLRKSPSVDKNGKKVGDSGYNANEGGMTDSSGVMIPTPTGMGWFPGYAVNLETGERLNMAFGEDSYLTQENGADMKWNPTSTTYSSNFDPIFGGKHYVYVFGHNGNATFASSDALLPRQLRDIPRYDNGYTLYKLYKAYDVASNALYKREIYIDAMWVNIPLLAPGHSLLENEAKVRLRVTRSYQKYGTGTSVAKNGLTVGQHYFVEGGPIKHGTVTYNTGTSFTATVTNWVDSVGATPTYGARVVTTQNKANGLYEFNTADIETHTNEGDIAKEALDLINIVPNPYYAYSGYEKTTLDNVVKITNLPAKCTVSIYTLNGNLVRRFKRDDSGAEAKTSLDWDLKNEARIPIASGLYIIHVDVPEVGEKILKWFGVLRPIDIEAY